jgi:hypothetical protein
MRKVSSSRLLTREGNSEEIEDDMMSPTPEASAGVFPEFEKTSSDEEWDEDEKLLDDTTREAKKLRKESKTRIPSAGKQFKSVGHSVMVYDVHSTQQTELPTTAAERIPDKKFSPSTPTNTNQQKVDTLLKTIVTFGGLIFFFI